MVGGMTKDRRLRGSGAALPWRRRPVVVLLTRYAWRFRSSYVAGGVFLWLTNLLAVSIPGQIGFAVDALRVDAPVGRFVAMIAVMGALVIVTRTASRILIFNPGRHLEYHLRKDLFSHLLRLQPSFFVGHQRGDIVSRAANDISWVRTMVGYGGLQIVNVTLAVTLTGWKMVALSPRLTVLVLVPVLVGMAAVQWAIRRLFHLSLRNQEQLGEISEHVLGTLQGMATIQGFVAEGAFEERFEQRNLDWLRTGIRIALVRSLALPLLVLAGGVAMFVLIVVGGPLVLSGTLTIGELAAFTALLTVLLPPLRSLGWLLSVVQRGRAALDRIFELMNAPLDRPEGTHGRVLESGRGPSLVVEGLDFAYPDEPGRKALEGICTRIEPGTVVGLFGRTGSGKSTLLRVLARLYNPPEGSITVDGVDLLDLDLDHWRDRLVMVPQRPFLFSDTVLSNIALETEPDVARVERVCEAAALLQDLEALPDGLQTVVGERGIMLSGGQRQRVALARGLYRGGDVLVLDDVLSAVDHETEARLVDTISGLARQPSSPTVFIASHRLSALRHTDLVLVLEDGRLVEQGHHEELVARDGIYRETWLAQSQRSTKETVSQGVAS